MIMEVFLDPNRDLAVDDPIIITQFNVSKAIKDSILVNFGECGLASSFGSFQVKYVNPITKLCIIRASREEYQKLVCHYYGSIRACRNAALKCDKAKFEQYKLVVGDRLTDDINNQMQNCLERIKILEH
ncbi:putative ribonuclease P/MRP protein subunit POP5 [Vitis vinifera]|uniref:Putative ribonuclease P/MRP protein subunit POP5 n=1 Tax=Vitis vinifera TaxID=29760 RepID=A0A438E0R0_VITVI|nr:putative ribonuclease P/MRP protein subunit POP5 [Vitis vinifera]